MKKINKNTTLSKLLEIKGAEEILKKHRLPCMHCPMAQMEMDYLKLQDVCNIYGLDLDKIMKDLEKLK
jgi:hypothetical protein